MRKISRFCRQRCQQCRAIFAGITILICFAFSYQSALAQQILLPEPPPAAPPPALPREKDPIVIRAKERESKAANQLESEKKSRQAIAQQANEEKAKEEAKKPRDFYGFMELSLVQPQAIVSSGRSNYSSDMTSHISAYARLFWKSEASTVQPWAGLRIAPFGGIGTQKKLTARFAHTWMGPAIGVGSVTHSDNLSSDVPTRSFWLVSGGIAAVNRLVARDESATPLPEDFKPTPWAYEPPGTWAELRWSRIIRGAIGLGGMGGIQTGKGKIFYYAGLTISGFY